MLETSMGRLSCPEVMVDEFGKYIGCGFKYCNVTGVSAESVVGECHAGQLRNRGCNPGCLFCKLNKPDIPKFCELYCEVCNLKFKCQAKFTINLRNLRRLSQRTAAKVAEVQSQVRRSELTEKVLLSEARKRIAFNMPGKSTPSTMPALTLTAEGQQPAFDGIRRCVQCNAICDVRQTMAHTCGAAVTGPLPSTGPRPTMESNGMLNDAVYAHTLQSPQEGAFCITASS